MLVVFGFGMLCGAFLTLVIVVFGPEMYKDVVIAIENFVHRRITENFMRQIDWKSKPQPGTYPAEEDEDPPTLKI